jgi:hypothetical protein
LCLAFLALAFLGCKHLAVTYSSTYGIDYPSNQASLAPAAAATSAAADLIDNVLSTGTKSGYSFTFTGAAAVGGAATASSTPIGN